MEQDSAARYNFDERDYWETRLFSCLKYNLKTIEITGFMKIERGYSFDCEHIVEIFLQKQDSKLKFMSFLLKNAMVLEKMTIHVARKPVFVGIEGWSRMLLRAVKKVREMPRGSTCLKVMFSIYV